MGDLLLEPKPKKKAMKLVEAIRKSGIQIERIPPSQCIRVLSYVEISDFLDALIADLYRLNPELFDSTATNFFNPAWLKGYFYVCVMWHLHRVGALQQTGGQVYPDATGYHVPVALLAWLSRIGPYSEGDCDGIVKYNTPSTLPVIGTIQMVVGAVAETAIANTTFVNLAAWQASAAGGEPYANLTAASAITVIQNWSNNATQISSMLKSINYACTGMPEDCAPVPDGSFFAFPAINNASAVASNNPMLASPFIKWDAEVASLYYTTADIAATTNSYPAFAPRCGPMATIQPNGAAGNTFTDSFFYLKCCFVFLCRHNPGINLLQPTVVNLRAYHGEKLATFFVRTRFVDFRGFNEAVARAIMCCFDCGAAFNSTQAYAALVAHASMLHRKLNLFSPVVINVATTVQQAACASQWDAVPALAPIAQLINEFGPTILEGNLFCPSVLYVAGNAAWFSFFDTLGSNTLQGQLHNYQLVNATGGTITWTSKGGGATNTLNGAWRTSYGGTAGVFLYTPWWSIAAYTRQLEQLSQAAATIAKGDITFNCSRGPRGGLSMQSLAFISGNNYTNDVWSNATQFISNALEQFGSHVALSADDIVLAAILRPNLVANVQLQLLKYLKTSSYTGQNPYLDEYIMKTIGSGGTFVKLLAAEMEKMHGVGDMKYGMALPRDNMDQCLWGALKGIVGTIAQAVQPAASAAAAIGCAPIGAIPVVGQFLKPSCTVMAKNLVNYAADTSRVSTNRNEHTPVSVALAGMEKMVAESRREERTMAPEERHEIRPIKVKVVQKAKSTAKPIARAPPPKKKARGPSTPTRSGQNKRK